MGRAGLKAAALASTAVGAIVWSAVLATAAPAERRLISADGFTAVVEAKADWCQAEVEVALRAESVDKFKGDRRGVQRMLGRLRGILGVECPAATTIRLTGLVGTEFVYDGIASKEGQWILFEMPALLSRTYVDPPERSVAAPSISPAAAAPAGPVDDGAACDRLASHPDDPERPEGVAGVADDAVDATASITACGAAVKADPDEPRYKFQLARAYLFTERNEDALDLLVAAAEEGHGASLAYLGDLVLYGAGGIESDPEAAKNLYLSAVEAGFKPAQTLADGIVADAQADPQQEAPAVEFHYPNFVSAFSEGRKPESILTWAAMAHYAVAGLTGIREECPSLVPNRDWAADFLRAAMNRMNFLQLAVLSDHIQSGGMDDIMQEGMDDGYGLAVTKGCNAQETQNFVAAVKFYI